MELKTNATVATQVRYLTPEWQGRTELPRIYDRDSRRANTELRNVTVRDARQSLNSIELDRNGFQLLEFQSPIDRFDSAPTITRLYYPTISEFVKRTVGADEIYVTQHLIRTEDKSDFNTAYARFVHCDYSVSRAKQHSLDRLKKEGKRLSDYEEAEFAWYNTWQPFDHTAVQNPLALLDSATLRDGDIVDYIYDGYGKGAKGSMPVYRDQHQFYFYSDMTPDEVLLIKQLDSRLNRAKVSPHTSIIDANAPADAPPRRSIEVRLLAVFR